MVITSLNPHSPVKYASLLDVQCLYSLEEATPNVLKYVLTAYIVCTNNFSLDSHLYIITWEKYGQQQNQEAEVLMKDLGQKIHVQKLI